MKALKSSTLFVFLFLFFTSFCFSQSVFQHTSNNKNTKTHVTTISNKITDNKPNLILIVSQVLDKVSNNNNNEVGIWYNNGKWKIFNETRTPIPENAKFNVLAIDPKDVKDGFIHTTNQSNTIGHITTINHIKTNNNPRALLFITQNYGKYNTSPIGVWYKDGKWKIYNEKRTKMPIGTKFNILTIPKNMKINLNNKLKGKASIHTTSADNIQKNHTRFKIEPSIKNVTNYFFSTQNYLNTYNPSTVAINNQQSKWSLVNLDKRKMKKKVRFNILQIETPIFFPVVGRTYPTPNILRQKPIIYNPKKWKVIPSFRPNISSGSSSQNTNTEIMGPNLTKPRLLNLILDSKFTPLLKQLNIFNQLYEDKNKNSNVLYYLPSGYSLYWDKPSREYSLSVFYLSANEENGIGDVEISAQLKPNVKMEDIQLAEKILQKNYKENIRLMPLILQSTPTIDFGNSLSSFDAKDISISLPSDILLPIPVTWKMGRKVDDLVSAMMHNVGIHGNIEFKPAGGENQSISVPVNIKINDSSTFGNLEFKQASTMLNGIENLMDYPISINHVHVLRKKSNNKFHVESIPLDNHDIEPKKIFSSFSEDEKSKVLDGKEGLIERLWLDFTLLPCSNCDLNVKEKILSGISHRRIQKITVKVLSILEYSESVSIYLFLKSKQGDPRSESEVSLQEKEITEDHIDFKGGELFVPEGSEIEFDYKLHLVMPDGEVKESEWSSHKSPILVLGEKTIKTLFEENSTGEGN